jgi:hypothetical protein
MQRHPRWLVFFAVVCLSACCAVTPRPKHPDYNPSTARQASAITNHWIGIKRSWSGPCPEAPLSGWKVHPLVSLETFPEKLRESARQAGLDRFCIYDYSGAEVRPELPRKITDQLRRAEPDTAAMARSGDALEEVTWRFFASRFLTEAGRPESLSLQRTSSPSVRLVFLDTQATGEALPEISGPSRHGYTLAHIAGRLACNDDQKKDCAARIATRLALPIIAFDSVLGVAKSSPSGGLMGSIGDLAEAIRTEVEEWNRNPHREQHLVLNLSLGWDGQLFGGWQRRVEDMPPDVQEVYSALDFAARNGVLVIAAAGNQLSGPKPAEVPLLPAGWEDETVAGRPLIYAASGIDAHGYRLANARARAEAPRVAYADHSVVLAKRDSHGEEPTATLTGSSVASAVVSTVASVVWSYRPGLNPAAVMQLLSSAGEDLHRRPDFGSEPLQSTGVRRISLCGALLRACSTPGTPCGVPACARNDEKLRAMQRIPTLPALVTDRSMDAAGLSDALTDVTPRCRANPIFHHPGRLPTNPCPAERFTNLLVQAWTNPQPGEDPCPNCVVTGPPREIARLAFEGEARSDAEAGSPSYTLRIQIPSDWAYPCLQVATLEVLGVSREGRDLRTAYAIDSNLCANGSLTVTNLHFEGYETITQAVLSFASVPPAGALPGTPTLSIQSSLFVEP